MMYFCLVIGLVPSSLWAFQVALVVKNPLANAGDIRDVSLIPGSGRSPGGGHNNSLKYSCLENPMDRETWQATVHGMAERQGWAIQHSTAQGLTSGKANGL